MYLSLHDAKMRLDDTLIRYKGEPIYVITVDQPRVNYILTVSYLRTLIEAKVSLKDKDIDLSPVPLGNMNHEGNVYFTSRAPHRVWKQGLSRDTFMCKSMVHGYVGINVNCKALVNTINNEYPSLKESCRMIAEGVMVSCAFSRNFSLIDKRKIVFRSKLVIGVLSKDMIYFELEDKFLYLKEHLQHSMIGQ